MTVIQMVTLIAAALGVAGTIVLYLGSYALEPLEGAAFGGPILDAWNEKVRRKNRARVIKQRVGIALIGGELRRPGYRGIFITLP
jgi:hypothetical protein